MKKIIPLLLAFLMLTACLALSGCGKEKQVLNLYSWDGMFPQEVLDAFTAETGIEINYVFFDTDETMLAKLQAAKGGEYDVIIADDYIVELAVNEGLVKKLDKSRLNNIGNVNPYYQGQFYDPSDDYSVPYGAGIIELVYYPEKTGFEIKNYEDLWNESLAGRVGVIGNYRVVNGMALKVLGYSFNTTDKAQLAEAGELMNRLSANIRIINDNYLNDNLLSGEIDAALMYTSQATLACTADSAVKAVLPETGLGFGIMPMFIASNAPHEEAAYKFMDYILQAETAAECFEYIGYYSTNSAADAYISDEMKPYLTLPVNATDDKEIIQNVPDEINDIHEEIWNNFRKNCD